MGLILIELTAFVGGGGRVADYARGRWGGTGGWRRVETGERVAPPPIHRAKDGSSPSHSCSTRRMSINPGSAIRPTRKCRGRRTFAMAWPGRLVPPSRLKTGDS